MSEQDPTTKPTMETLLDMMREMRAEVRAGFAQVEKRFDGLELKIDVLNRDMLQLRADYEGLDRRVSRLEEARR